MSSIKCLLYHKIKCLAGKFCIICIALCTVYCPSLHGQLVLGEDSYPGNVAQGPTTLIPPLHFLKKMDDNRLDLPDISTTVTFSLENMQVEGVGVESVLSFGSSDRETMKWPKSEFVYQQFKALGRPVGRLYTNGPQVGEGILVGSNYGVWLFASIRHLSKSNRPKAGETQYLGDFIIEFNRPVNDPIIHLSGMGGIIELQSIIRGFSVELELMTPNAHLVKLSGTDEFEVSPDVIFNNSKSMGANCGSGSACGSVQVKGNFLSKLQFKVHLRRDSNEDGYRGRWPLMRNLHTGDGVMISVSFPMDGQVRGMVSLESEPGYEYGNKINDKLLRINVIDPIHQIVLNTLPVNEDGSFIISGFTSGTDYGIQLSTLKGTISKATLTSMLDDNWECKSIIVNEQVLEEVNSNTVILNFDQQPEQNIIFRLGHSLSGIFTDIVQQSDIQSVELPITKTEEKKETVEKEIKDELAIEEKITTDDHAPLTNEPIESNIETELEDLKNEQVSIVDSITSSKTNACIIITGSFTLPLNVEQMQSKIESLGLELYTAPGPGNFTRVGVVVDCKEIDAILPQIQSKIEADAWILDEIE